MCQHVTQCYIHILIHSLALPSQLMVDFQFFIALSRCFRLLCTTLGVALAIVSCQFGKVVVILLAFTVSDTIDQLCDEHCRDWFGPQAPEFDPPGEELDPYTGPGQTTVRASGG